MMFAECDSCGKKLPCRYVGGGLNGGDYVIPQFWFEHPTSHPEVRVLACCKACCESIDLTRAINKAKHLSGKADSFHEKK